VGLKHNNTICTGRSTNDAFNRTSVGLKLAVESAGNPNARAFNRTSVGLKPSVSSVQNRRIESFNRTSVGLKLYQSKQVRFDNYHLLIEPVWD